MQYKHEPLDFHLSLISLNSVKIKKNSELKMSKKGDFENPKVQIHDFSTTSVSNYCNFSNSAVCWGTKNSTNRGIRVFFKKIVKKNFDLFLKKMENTSNATRKYFTHH